MSRAAPPTLHEQTLAPGILRWLITNPQRRNAIGPDVFAWIVERCASLAGEVVIVRGEGEQVFSAGFDLKSLADRVGPQASGDAPDLPLLRATAAMHDADATFVACINGLVIGAGVELVCSCDLRIAKRGATLRVPAGRIGVVYHAAGLARIHAALGPTVVRRLFLVGDEVPIEDAREGLVALVEPDSLDAETLALAQRITALSPHSVAGNRRFLRALERAHAVPSEVLDAHERARDHAYATIPKPTVGG